MQIYFANGGTGLDIIQIATIIAVVFVLGLIGSYKNPKPTSTKKELEWFWVCVIVGLIRLGLIAFCFFLIWKIGASIFTWSSSL
jgi:hypothetical protein